MKLILLLIFLTSVTSYVQAAKILAVLPFPGKSHYIFGSSVVKALAQKGHKIVEYSPFPPKTTIPNLTHVKVYTYLEKLFGNWKFEDMMEYNEEENKIFGLSWLNLWNFLTPVCDETLKSESMKNLLQSNEHFDLVLTTSTFGQESMLLFGHKFGAPTITLQGFQHSVTLNRNAGNDLMIATIPDSMSFAFTDRMTFTERLQNFISSSLTLLIYYSSHLPEQEKIIKKYYNAPNMPSVVEMVNNVSLTLVNTHPATSYPQSFTPNVIPIGGITVSPERIPLPQDIKMFMDDAKEGVIYFSFGTVVTTHTFPQKYIQIFVDAFKKLPQRVLWKTEADNVPGLSENVKLVRWVPQPGVLGHPNCVAFITHGGVYSQLEAVHAGVPVVGIPFFGDQFFNVRFNEERGIGIKVDFQTLTEESLASTITTVINKPRYKENAARLSRIFRDMPISPVDTAVFWIEYVLRHDGAPHLRPVSSSLMWYQLMLIDVAGVVLVACLIVSLVVYKAVRKIGSLVFGKRSITKDKKYK